MKYLERKYTEGKYSYLVECPECNSQRWVKNLRSPYCRSCAGKLNYKPATVEKKNARKRGDGYITKQGYHLVYEDGAYIPAHRMMFEDLPKDYVVHHVDGNKLNNILENLYPCSKQEHREIHGQLERLSYYLIQQGFIDFTEGAYNFGTSIKEFMLANSVNSGNTVSIDIDGNPEPSPEMGRCNDYPGREYTQASGSAENPNK